MQQWRHVRQSHGFHTNGLSTMKARSFDSPYFAISLLSSSFVVVVDLLLLLLHFGFLLLFILAMKSPCSCSTPTSSTSFPACTSSSSPRNWKKDLRQQGILVVKVYSDFKISSSFQFVRSSRNVSVLRFRNPAIRSEKSERTSSYCTSTSRPQVKELIEFLVRKSSSFVVEWSQLNLMKLFAFLAFTFMVIPSSEAVDALKTCTCLLKECRIELAKCIANPLCAANVACLQTCNNRPDETECQIKCGDLFENKVVDEFNECAVSRKKCVPRKSDVGEFPVPDPSVLVKSFKISDFNGKWYITSGLNPVFDVFDCQLHEFHVESDKLIGNITWRIKTPDGGFFTRSTIQRFVQDPNQPGVLYNHDNEYLHYQDDWYILSSKVEQKTDDYIFVYYRGRNDAWDGYGGAVVYTRSAVLPENIIPELERSAKNVGRDFSKFIRTDNTCGPEPPLVERLEKKLEDGERVVIKEVEEIEEEVEKTEMTLLERLAEGLKKLKKDEDYFLRELSKEEMDLLNELKMEASEVESLFGKTLPLRKLR